ncbi:MAG: LytTR family DNA-binding domain-containing protein [Bacteroidales bacterium]|jgi:two-component system LytT family response regulator|nr:LytTR family DNA-binding domain-containing protein [Bacteroidales bacterium]
MNKKETKNKRITFPVIDGVIFCDSQNIVRIEALGKYSILYMTDSEDAIKLLVNIGEIERFLNEFKTLFRCHRSHIVNIQFIEKLITKSNIIVTQKGSVPISRRKKNEFLNIIYN